MGIGPAAWLDGPSDALWHFPAEGVDLSVSELRRRAREKAAALHERGIVPGDRVAVMLDNDSAGVCLLLALWHLGAIPVPLRPSRGAWSRDYLAQVDQICGLRLTIDDPGDLTSPHAPPAPHHALPEDLALIQFSSGSTGRQKGVIVTHAMVEAQVWQLTSNYVRAGEGTPPRSIASWLPLYHDMGLFIGLLLPLFLAPVSRPDTITIPR